MNQIPSISTRQLAELHAAGRPIGLIDVRTPAEFREVHAAIARNVPLEGLDPHGATVGRNQSSDSPLYVICRSGSRSTQACRKLLEAGYINIVNVEGGTQAWIDAGLPVVRGKKTISLERQVRIAAGFVVLAGALLALTVHPYFAVIPAIFGAGLMFAGITDTCGMALVLARMPWNQVPDGQSTNAACCSR